MKTILFVIPSFGGGGAERVLVNLVNNLDKTKYKVFVQTLFDVGVNKRYLDSEIEYIPGLKKQFPGNVFFMKLFTPKALYHLLVREKYDIIVSYLEGPAARIISGCPYEDTKLISWIHVEQHTKKVASYSFRSEREAETCYNRFDRTICVADSVLQDFTSLFHIVKPCMVLYNTNEDDRIRELGEEPVEDITYSNEINVCSVGRLRSEKGYDRLITVHKQLLDAGIKHHMYILGTGAQESKLKAKVAELSVSDSFHFLGFRDNPYKYVSKADLFVCSSRREGFSTAVTEALILGVPVVSTCCSGAYELLGKNNEYGIVTENSEQGIYDGMFQMLSTEGLLCHYKNKAKERGKYFSKENTVRAVEEMFDRL